MKSIAFYNNKGGVAKTTSVINLGYELAHKSKVLIIDTDKRIAHASLQTSRKRDWIRL